MDKDQVPRVILPIIESKSEYNPYLYHSRNSFKRHYDDFKFYSSTLRELHLLETYEGFIVPSGVSMLTSPRLQIVVSDIADGIWTCAVDQIVAPYEPKPKSVNLRCQDYTMLNNPLPSSVNHHELSCVHCKKSITGIKHRLRSGDYVCFACIKGQPEFEVLKNIFDVNKNVHWKRARCNYCNKYNKVFWDVDNSGKRMCGKCKHALFLPLLLNPYHQWLFWNDPFTYI